MNLPKILLIIGFIMPFLGPIVMVVGTEIYLYFTESAGSNENIMFVGIMKGIYFGVMLGIALIVISKILREIEKQKR